MYTIPPVIAGMSSVSVISVRPPVVASAARATAFMQIEPISAICSLTVLYARCTCPADSIRTDRTDSGRKADAVTVGRLTTRWPKIRHRLVGYSLFWAGTTTPVSMCHPRVREQVCSESLDNAMTCRHDHAISYAHPYNVTKSLTWAISPPP